MSRREIALTRIRYHGRFLTPVSYVDDGLVTLLPPRYARKLKAAGTVGILSEDEWNKIRAERGTINLEAQYR